MRLGVSGKRRRVKILPFLFTMIIIAAVILCGIRLHNAFVSTAHAYANNIATTAISNSAYEVFSKEKTEYSEVSSHDKAMLFETDTARLNLLNSKLANLIQTEVLSGDYETVYIPVGSALGIAAFSGIGPKLPVKMHPISLVNTDFHEDFDSCGVNQVRHSISLDIEIIMAYSGYFFTDKETVKVSVPLTDTVIVGDIPKYYGNGGVVGDME